MTYKLEAFIEKISSPVVILIDGEERYVFENGQKAYEAFYERYYLISDIRAEREKIYITLVENTQINDTNWCGEQQVSFF